MANKLNKQEPNITRLVDIEKFRIDFLKLAQVQVNWQKSDQLTRGVTLCGDNVFFFFFVLFLKKKVCVRV